MPSASTYTGLKDWVFGIVIISSGLAIWNLNAEIATLKNTNEKFSKQWRQIGTIKKDMCKIKMTQEFERGLRLGKQSKE